MQTPKYRNLIFKIDGYTPHTLPMARLAEYLRDLAALIGSDNDVHFIKVEEGSAELVHEVPQTHYAQVETRVTAAEKGHGPQEAVRAYRDLCTKLRHDGTPARFLNPKRATILEFPAAQTQPAFGAVIQPGTLEGVLIKIGGRDDTVPVHLQDGESYYKCSTNRELARQLAPRLFGDPLRVSGTGRWYRNEQAMWTLDWFKIASWESLNDDALEAVLARMRVAESNWDNISDPLAELRYIRKGSQKPQ